MIVVQRRNTTLHFIMLHYIELRIMFKRIMNVSTVILLTLKLFFQVYYWLLPPQFLGDKVTSYGGHLNYTVRYVPTPGGQSSRNNAPDVELISVSQL